jgi:O-antigen/teichoic acid export membrane protein
MTATKIPDGQSPPVEGRRLLERPWGPRLLGGGAWALASKCVGGAVGLGITALLARLLTPPEFGAYLIAFSIVTLAAMSARFGLDQAGLRLVSEHLGRGEEVLAGRIAWRVLGIVACASAALGIAFGLAVGPWLVQQLFRSDLLEGNMLLAGAWLACLAVQLTLAELFRACRDIRMASVLAGTLFGGVLSTILIALAILLVWLLGVHMNVRGALLISVVGTAAATAFGLAMLARRFGVARVAASPRGTRPLALGAILKLALPLLLAQLGTLVLVQADIWILGAFRPEREVALYGAASRVVKSMALLLAVANEVTAPEIARLNVQGERERLADLLGSTAALGALPALALLVVLAVAAEDVLEVLFGTFYREAGVVLLILATGQAVNVFLGSTHYALVMTGHGTLRMGVALAAASSLVASVWR